MVVVSVCVVVPHVGGEVAVDVGVGEVCGEAQAEDEASQDTKPTPSAATNVGGEGLLHISVFTLCTLSTLFTCTFLIDTQICDTTEEFLCCL